MGFRIQSAQSGYAGSLTRPRFFSATATVAKPESPTAQASPAKPGRHAKVQIGGYFEPDGQTIVAFQKLKVDLLKSQQEMLFEALRILSLSMKRPGHSCNTGSTPPRPAHGPGVLRFYLTDVSACVH